MLRWEIPDGARDMSGVYLALCQSSSSGAGFDNYAMTSVIPEITGRQGTQGLQGLQGLSNQGTQGLQGLQGTQGIQGLQGLQGLSNQGTQGLQGIQGLQGTQGAQGLQGTQGLQGLQGNIANFQGTQGLSNQGTQGLSGYVTFENKYKIRTSETTPNSASGSGSGAPNGLNCRMTGEGQLRLNVLVDNISSSLIGSSIEVYLGKYDLDNHEISRTLRYVNSVDNYYKGLLKIYLPKQETTNFLTSCRYTYFRRLKWYSLHKYCNWFS